MMRNILLDLKQGQFIKAILGIKSLIVFFILCISQSLSAISINDMINPEGGSVIYLLYDGSQWKYDHPKQREEPINYKPFSGEIIGNIPDNSKVAQISVKTLSKTELVFNNASICDLRIEAGSILVLKGNFTATGFDNSGILEIPEGQINITKGSVNRSSLTIIGGYIQMKSAGVTSNAFLNTEDGICIISGDAKIDVVSASELGNAIFNRGKFYIKEDAKVSCVGGCSNYSGEASNPELGFFIEGGEFSSQGATNGESYNVVDGFYNVGNFIMTGGSVHFKAGSWTSDPTKSRFDAYGFECLANVQILGGTLYAEGPSDIDYSKGLGILTNCTFKVGEDAKVVLKGGDRALLSTGLHIVENIDWDVKGAIITQGGCESQCSYGINYETMYVIPTLKYLPERKILAYGETAAFGCDYFLNNGLQKGDWDNVWKEGRFLQWKLPSGEFLEDGVLYTVYEKDSENEVLTFTGTPETKNITSFGTNLPVGEYILKKTDKEETIQQMGVFSQEGSSSNAKDLDDDTKTFSVCENSISTYINTRDYRILDLNKIDAPVEITYGDVGWYYYVEGNTKPKSFTGVVIGETTHPITFKYDGIVQDVPTLVFDQVKVATESDYAFNIQNDIKLEGSLYLSAGKQAFNKNDNVKILGSVAQWTYASLPVETDGTLWLREQTTDGLKASVSFNTDGLFKSFATLLSKEGVTYSLWWVSTNGVEYLQEYKLEDNTYYDRYCKAISEFLSYTDVRTAWSVTYKLKNLTTDGTTSIDDSEYLSFTLFPVDNYKLPSSIIITMGGTLLNESTMDYIYDKNTGEVRVIGRVRGDVVVEASGVNDPSVIESEFTLLKEGNGEFKATYTYLEDETDPESIITGTIYADTTYTVINQEQFKITATPAEGSELVKVVHIQNGKETELPDIQPGVEFDYNIVVADTLKAYFKETEVEPEPDPGIITTDSLLVPGQVNGKELVVDATSSDSLDLNISGIDVPSLTVRQESNVVLVLSGTNALGTVTNKGTLIVKEVSGQVDAVIVNEGKFIDETGTITEVKGGASLSVTPMNDQTVDEGETVTLTAEVEASGDVSFQWQKYVDNTWESVESSPEMGTRALLRRSSTHTNRLVVSSAEAGLYRCKITCTSRNVSTTLTTFAIVTVNTDTDEPEDPDTPTIDPVKYYNITSTSVCDGIEISFSKGTVREGGSVIVYVEKDEANYTFDNLKLYCKRTNYGAWEELQESTQPGEYKINNIWTHIYVKAEGSEKKNPTGMEEVEGVKVYTKDGSLFVQTPQREQVIIISMTGAVVKNEEQVGLKQYHGLNPGIYIVRIGEQVFKIRI